MLREDSARSRVDGVNHRNPIAAPSRRMPLVVVIAIDVTASCPFVAVLTLPVVAIAHTVPLVGRARAVTPFSVVGRALVSFTPRVAIARFAGVAVVTLAARTVVSVGTVLIAAIALCAPAAIVSSVLWPDS